MKIPEVQCVFFIPALRLSIRTASLYIRSAGMKRLAARIETMHYTILKMQKQYTKKQAGFPKEKPAIVHLAFLNL